STAASYRLLLAPSFSFCLFSSLSCRFFFNAPAPTEIYTLSLHDALPIFGVLITQILKFWKFVIELVLLLWRKIVLIILPKKYWKDRKSTRLNSSHVSISYAVFCLKKKKEKKEEHM